MQVCGLIGFDCGAPGLNVTTISAVDIADCNMEDLQPKTENVRLQLLQLAEFDHTEVIQCKVEIDRIIYRCGMFSHNSVVHNGRREYLMSISQTTCKQMQYSGFLNLGGNTQLTDLKRNSTDSRSITLAGALGTDGSCEGTQYGDPYGTWSNVIVQASVKITLRNYEAPVKLSTGQIMLQSGTHCDVEEGACLDNEGGDTFWSPLPIDSCHFNNYNVLYEGDATKITANEKESTPTVYTVTTHDTTFALTKTSETNLCGYLLIKTEHPKLLLLEIKQGQTFRIYSRIPIDNLDIFTYVNSKFVYVEKHIRTQMTQLYKDMMAQKCALEKQIIKNALSFAAIAPEEMAYSLMKGPGYTAIAAGEVIHIIKCIPVECQLRPTQQCYNELAVEVRNETRFLQPKTHILLRTGTPRDCNQLLPVTYKILGTWYKMLPRPIETLAPATVQPLTKPTWKYANPSSLATNGIYTAEDLDRLRDHIMFPIEKPAMLNTIARGAMGEHIPAGSISMYGLFDEDTLNKIADSAGSRLWKSFLTFGTASAGVIGIFIALRLIKGIVDIVIHGYALHSIYGWSIHLLGALWSSITNLLLHLARPVPHDENQPRETELQTIETSHGGRPPQTAESNQLPPQPPPAPSQIPDQERKRHPEMDDTPTPSAPTAEPRLHRTRPYADLRAYLASHSDNSETQN